MMDTRVLDLLKNPKNIQSEDLQLLKKEIDLFPYIQNIRALHLYGVHLYDTENYQKELTTTAAYTTDKKILYQFINGKIQNDNLVQEEEISASVEEEVLPEPEIKENLPEEIEPVETKHDYTALSNLLVNQHAEIKTIFVNGERNRILFEGEENFLDEQEHDIIDIESTLESGEIVTHKALALINETSSQDTLQEEIEVVENLVDDLVLVSQNEEEIIDKESEELVEIETEESEIISSENDEEITIENSEIEENKEVLNSETIIDEDKITSIDVTEKVEDESELSFHATESFLPEIKIESTNSEQNPIDELPKVSIHKHEDEMRRLIEEVEKKMKAQKKQDFVEQEEEIGSEVSFAETQDFHIGEEQKIAEEVVIQNAEHTVEEQLEMASHSEEIVSDDSIREAQKEEVSTWKPMNFESHLPDSYSKMVDINNESPKEITQNVDETMVNIIEDENTTEIFSSENNEVITENEEENEVSEVPVMNVSFFGNDIASLPVEKIAPKQESSQDNVSITENKEEDQKQLDSNVPGFINTWQSWLKIDRTEEVIKAKAEIKNKAIESFIENNPKISQLKDEVNFVVKEKTDDISHLMTETLANLYVEQKLFTKAIKAFKVLIEKHPDRKDHFESKIQEIKENRSKS